VNLSLVRLLLLIGFLGIIYLSFGIVVINQWRPSEESEAGLAEGLVEELVDVPAPDPRFNLVGGSRHVSRPDFRNHPSQDVGIPDVVLAFEGGVVEGLGEKGKAVLLAGEEQRQGEAANKVWAFNKVTSDKISLWRSLPDMRLSQCRMLQYPQDLPTSSVIIIFNNEALSALLRTVWSVLDRSPSHLLHEIILVDDASNQTEITQILPEYIKHRLPPKVKLIRTPSQLGLIRARLTGAEVASGDILVFLDSHCEATKGWLEPMSDRIREDPTVVQIPRIDQIDSMREDIT